MDRETKEQYIFRLGEIEEELRESIQLREKSIGDCDFGLRLTQVGFFIGGAGVAISLVMHRATGVLLNGLVLLFWGYNHRNRSKAREAHLISKVKSECLLEDATRIKMRLFKGLSATQSRGDIHEEM